MASLLRGWKGGPAVVSHHRAPLREMDRILERSGLRGGEPRMMLDARERRIQATAERGELLAEPARRGRGSVGTRRANVERLKTLAVALPSSGLTSGKRVLMFDVMGVSWSAGKPVLNGVGFDLVGPRRVALTGPNGADKTTLLRLGVGDLAPSAGRIVRGGRVAPLDQRTVILAEDWTLLAAYRRLNPGGSDNGSRASLARFLFWADAALKLVAALSGGGRAARGAGLRARRRGPAPTPDPGRADLPPEPRLDRGHRGRPWRATAARCLWSAKIGTSKRRSGWSGRSGWNGRPRPERSFSRNRRRGELAIHAGRLAARPRDQDRQYCLDDFCTANGIWICL